MKVIALIILIFVISGCQSTRDECVKDLSKPLSSCMGTVTKKATKVDKFGCTSSQVPVCTRRIASRISKPDMSTCHCVDKEALRRSVQRMGRM